jgi:hypothetical protein
MKIKDESKPNRRMVESLFRDLRSQFSRGREGYGEEYTRLSKQYKKLRDKLLANKTLLALEKRMEQITTNYSSVKEQNLAKINRVYRRYLAHGVTPSILRDLQDLVSKLEKIE